jgi:hypothetical protein
MGEKTKRTYVRGSAQLWNRIREDYEAGASVDALNVHYGPSRTEIYRHIREEGWRRRPRPLPEPLAGGEPVQPAQVEASLDEAVERVIGDAVAAVLTCRTREAGELAALAERLMRLKARATPEPVVEPWRPARDVMALIEERFGGGAG